MCWVSKQLQLSNDEYHGTIVVWELLGWSCLHPVSPIQTISHTNQLCWLWNVAPSSWKSGLHSATKSSYIIFSLPRPLIILNHKRTESFFFPPFFLQPINFAKCTKHWPPVANGHFSCKKPQRFRSPSAQAVWSRSSGWVPEPSVQEEAQEEQKNWNKPVCRSQNDGDE